VLYFFIGGYQNIMVGPPDSGMTMLAKRLPTFLTVHATA
jgi:predicted ATPase with chaperone activity